ncbi:MAG: TetR/AcrR family transcriptional regulator [Acidobacteria bacterium]|nr:TetR/AcrR family transcriptional regulator [Acidobacteriota bacterium]
MRYDTDHKERTHQKILKTAAREVRARGLQGPGVAEVMKASGLTVGGFYKHFHSREELLAEAIEAGFSDFSEHVLNKLKDVPAGERWKQIVRWYLTLEHCEHPAVGCPVAALASDVARAKPAIRRRVAGLLKARRQLMTEFMPGKNPAEKQRNFVVIFTAMAGAVAIARIFPDRADRQGVLEAMRDHLLESF